MAGWLTIGPHLSAPNVKEDSTPNVLHKQGLPWSIFEAPTAGPGRPVFAHNSGTTQQSDGAPQKLRNILKRLTLMQWNCDYLATKIPELRVVIKKYEVDIILLQETKLGLEDLTPLLEGFDAIRTDRKGSGTHKRRGGGLITYIKKASNTRCPSAPQ